MSRCKAHSIEVGRCVIDWPHYGTPHKGVSGTSWMCLPADASEPPTQRWVRETAYTKACDDLDAAVAEVAALTAELAIAQEADS